MNPIKAYQEANNSKSGDDVGDVAFKFLTVRESRTWVTFIIVLCHDGAIILMLDSCK